MNPNTLVIVGIALLLSVLLSKISDRFGIPTLLLFLVLGMLVGSDGPGGVYFDDPVLAQTVGVIALFLILFSGGFDTSWASVRPVLKESWTLATLGVAITAGIVGLAVSALLDLPLLQGLLVGSIISSTDAAAVFAVLRSKGVSLRGQLKPLLEMESGSNDPMAVFLTIGLIELITHPEASATGLIVLFFQQMLIGAAMGYAMGYLMYLLVKHLRLGYEGLYPVLTLALACLTYGLTAAIGGSGFLAAYLAGIVLGNREFPNKHSLSEFHDGLAWLMQIAMFLTLGLLVFPSRMIPLWAPALLTALILMFLARPVSVFLGLIPARLERKEKVFISWVGLRGAAPIILATFPFVAGLPEASMIFHVVFFVVLTSVLLQGVSLPYVAKWLGVDAPPDDSGDDPARG
jgi:potassium/hydrogen antiporter